MSYLSLDWGLKKIGVATADPNGWAITPRAVIYRKTSPQLWSLTQDDKKILLSLKEQYEIEVIVLGNPINKNKAPLALQNAYWNFCKKLGECLKVPIETQDETLSSWEAKKLSDAQEHEDSLAAALTLESFFLHRSKK